MAQWNMTVIGTGAHHNYKHDAEGKAVWNADTQDYERAIDYDADVLFKEFVAKLNSAGHLITHASFTHGGREVSVHNENTH